MLPHQRWYVRLLKPAIPIAVVLLLMFALGSDPDAGPFTTVVVFALCAAILWLGWSWVRRSVVTKWIGLLLTVLLTLVLGLVVLGLTLQLGLLLLLLLLLTIPFLVYDLFFRQPHKGRFSRARAERKNIPLL
jgi:hypothetical protein